MAQQDIVVRVRAEIGAFKRDMDAAAQAAKKTGDQTRKAGAEAESGIGRLTTVAENHSQAWGMVSTGLLAGGAAIVAGLGLATKAAISWESAWAGVMKTVDDSPEGYAELESELRGLAKTLPSTHAEIAGVAEAAGQLGVAREDITGFTKTMIDLGESTNLTAEEAATNIAQISNVMGTMSREGSKGVERFGSALVALGNNGASTEADILNMAQRIAGAAATVGASESDVLALSNTLTSMGINAEMGGGVVTRVLLKMRTAVDEGGDSLTSFAETAGLSAEEFATKFRESPVEALDLVTQGLGNVNDAGGNVTAALGDLGIKGTQEMQVMLALAASGDLLTESLDLGAEAWKNNTALVEEANQRYATAESRIKIAWNNIKDVAITAGGAILPVVSSLADGIADLAGWFGDLPEPVQIALTALGGVAGVGLLAAGGFMKIVSALGDTVPKMKALGIATPRATRAVGLLGKTLGGVTAVGAGLLIGKEVIEAINDAARSGRPDVEDYFNAIATGGDVVGALDLGKDAGWTGALFPESEANRIKDFYGTITVESGAAKRAIEMLGNTDGLTGLSGWFSKNLSFGDVRKATEDALQLQEAMGGISRAFEMGQTELGIEAFSNLTSELNLTKDEMATLIDATPALKTALMSIATEGGIQIDPNNSLGLAEIALGETKIAAEKADPALKGVADAFGQTEEEAQAAADAVMEYYDSMVAAGMIVLNEREAQRGFQEALKGANDALKENGKTLDINTEKGRANQAALDNISDSAWSVFETLKDGNGTMAEMAAALGNGREQFINMAMDMGMSETAAIELADSMGLIPSNVVTTFDSNSDDIGDRIIDLHEVIQATPDKTITLEDNSPEVKQALRDLGYVIRELPDGRIEVTDDGTAETTGKKIDTIAGKYREAQIIAAAATNGAEAELNHTARPRTSLIRQTINRTIKESWQSNADNGPTTSRFGRQHGGQLPNRAAGGRLPYTGLGTDMILGVSSEGRPVANVDDGEWIIRESSSDKYNGLLTAVNNDDSSVQYLADSSSGMSPALAVPASQEVASYAQGMGSSALRGYQGPVASNPAPNITVQVENMTVDSKERIDELSQALFTHADRASRANGQVRLGGVTQS